MGDRRGAEQVIGSEKYELHLIQNRKVIWCANDFLLDEFFFHLTSCAIILEGRSHQSNFKDF